MNIYSIFPLLTAVIALFLGVFIVSKISGSRSNIYFSLLCFTTFIWQFTWAILFSITNSQHVLFLVKIGYSGIIFIPIVFFHFIARFTKSDKDQLLICASYLFGFSLLYFLWNSNYFINNYYTYYWGYYPKAGFLHPSYLFLVFFLAFREAMLLLHEIRTKIASSQKSQYGYLLLGLSIYFFSCSDFIINYGYGFYPFGFIFVLIALGLIAYAITKTELMDMRVAITRSAAYGTVGVLLVGSFMALNIAQMPTLLLFTANTLLCLFWVFYAERLRNIIQTPIEEKWITGWYNSDNLINNIAQSLIPIMEKEKAFEVIANKLKDTIKIKNVKIMSSGELVADSNSILDVAPFDKLPQGMKNALAEYSGGVFIPLKSSEGYEGGIVLGQKKSEDSYNKKDYTLFKTIMIQTLAILDRIRPYEKIKKEFEANEKKLYDTERLLARSEKIASLANLIREYNHEIKTPLAIIRGETERLRKEPRDKAYLEWFTSLVLKHVDRADDIVESTLRLSRQKEHTEVDVNINEAIEEALKLYPPSGVSLVKEFGSIPIVRGDLSDLQSVFINLIKNAVEAMPDGGTLKIKTFAAKENDENLVYIEICDTGVGIPKENMEKIFEPFFSTHVTKGRGLGLSIIFRIIREHLGSIEVNSEPGKGSTFKIKLKAKKD